MTGRRKLSSDSIGSKLKGIVGMHYTGKIIDMYGSKINNCKLCTGKDYIIEYLLAEELDCIVCT